MPSDPLEGEKLHISLSVLRTLYGYSFQCAPLDSVPDQKHFASPSPVNGFFVAELSTS